MRQTKLQSATKPRNGSLDATPGLLDRVRGRWSPSDVIILDQAHIRDSHCFPDHHHHDSNNSINSHVKGN